MERAARRLQGDVNLFKGDGASDRIDAGATFGAQVQRRTDTYTGHSVNESRDGA